jgi:hypothetical protein
MVARETLSTDDLFEAANMALSTTIIPLSPHAAGVQAAVSQWLDRVGKSVQAGARRRESDPTGEARARILQGAAMTMLAPVEPGTRAVSHLLR